MADNDEVVSVINPDGEVETVLKSMIPTMPEGYRVNRDVVVRDPKGKQHTVSESELSTMPEGWSAVPLNGMGDFRAAESDRLPPAGMGDMRTAQMESELLPPHGMGDKRAWEAGLPSEPEPPANDPVARARNTVGFDRVMNRSNLRPLVENEFRPYDEVIPSEPVPERVYKDYYQALPEEPRPARYDNTVDYDQRVREDEALNNGHAGLAAMQGLTRYAGGDVLRNAFDRLETEAQKSLVRDPKIAQEWDTFQGRDEVRKNKEDHPVAATAGEIAGAIVPASLGARMAMAPTALLSRGAAKAGAFMAEQYTRPVARAAISYATAGAGEGVVYGAASEVNDAFLKHDYEGLAQKAIASGGMGALTGAITSTGLGLGFDALAGKLRGPANEARTSLRPEAVLARDVVDESTARNIKARSFATPAVADEIHQKAHRGIAKHMREFFAHKDMIANRVGIGAKKRFLTKFDTPFGVEKHGQESFDRVTRDLEINQEFVDSLKGDYGIVGSPAAGHLRNFEKKLGAFREALSTKDRAPTGQMYMILDDLKRELGRFQDNRNEFFRETMRVKYEKIRDYLENPEVWGQEIASAQKEVNKEWSNAIRKMKDSDLRRFFGQSSDQADDPFELLPKMDGPTLQAFLSKLGRAENEGAEDAFVSLLRAEALDAATRAKLWGGSAINERAKHMKSLVSQVEHDLGQVTIVNRDVLRDPQQSFLQKHAAPAGAGIGATIGTAIGYPLGGGVGASVGATTGGAIGNYLGKTLYPSGLPVTREEVLEFTRHYRLTGDAIRATKAVNRAAKLKGILQGPTVKRVKGAAKAAGQMGLDAGEKAEKALRIIRAPATQEVNKYIERAQETLETGDPDVQSSLMEVEDEEGGPEFATALRDNLTNQAKFLLEKAGPAPMDALGRPLPRDPTTMQRVGRYIAPMKEPLKALERLGDGHATDEDRETLSTLYPSLLREFQTKALDHMNASESTYDQRVRASLALGIAMDPFVDPAFSGWVSNVGAPEEGGEGEGQTEQAIPQGKVRFSSPMKVDQVYSSRADALAQAKAQARADS